MKRLRLSVIGLARRGFPCVGLFPPNPMQTSQVGSDRRAKENQVATHACVAYMSYVSSRTCVSNPVWLYPASLQACRRRSPSSRLDAIGRGGARRVSVNGPILMATTAVCTGRDCHTLLRSLNTAGACWRSIAARAKRKRAPSCSLLEDWPHTIRSRNRQSAYQRLMAVVA
jgi:hypothetical protein